MTGGDVHPSSDAKPLATIVESSDEPNLAAYDSTGQVDAPLSPAKQLSLEQQALEKHPTMEQQPAIEQQPTTEQQPTNLQLTGEHHTQDQHRVMITAPDALATAMTPAPTADAAAVATSAVPSMVTLSTTAATSSVEVAPSSTPLRIEVDLHMLRLDESVRARLLERGVLRLWAEVVLEPDSLQLASMRTGRISLPSKPSLKSTGSSVTELPLSLEGGTLEFDKESASARALADALRPESGAGASIKLHLYGGSPLAPASLLCSASLSMAMLLLRRSDLNRMPIQLNDESGLPQVTMLVTLRAGNCLAALAEGSVGAHKLASSPATNGALAAYTQRSPAQRVSATSRCMPSPANSAVARTGRIATPRSDGSASRRLPSELEDLTVTQPPVPVSCPMLPIYLELVVHALELVPAVCADARVSRVQIAIDLPTLSVAAVLTQHMRKPQVRERMAVDHRSLIPIYDGAYAQKCMHITSTAAAAASLTAIPATIATSSGGRNARTASHSGAAPSRSSEHSPSHPPSRGVGAPPRIIPMRRAPQCAADPGIVVRIVGSGRGGLMHIASATMSLHSLLTTPESQIELALSATSDSHATLKQPGGPSSPPGTANADSTTSCSRGNLTGSSNLERSATMTATAPLHSGSGSACAKVWLSGRLRMRAQSKPSAPPPPQRVDEPQVCVEVHSLRVPLHASTVPARASATLPTGLGGRQQTSPPTSACESSTRTAAPDAMAATPTHVRPPAEVAEVHTVWIAITLPGVDHPVCSETMRVDELVRAPEFTTALSNAPPLSHGGVSADANTNAVVTNAALASERAGGGRRMRMLREKEAGLMGWGARHPIDTVALAELYGEGAAAFDELRASLIQEGGQSGWGSGGGPLGERPPLGILIELRGAGRHGHSVIGTLRASLSEMLEMSRGSDLIAAPMRIRSSRGNVVSEVVVSVTLSRAVRALCGSVPSMLSRGLLMSQKMDGSGSITAYPGNDSLRLLGAKAGATANAGAGTVAGAAIAIGGGQAYLMMKTCQALSGLYPTSVWLEIDLRRAFGQILRSAPHPAVSSNIDFGFKELLYIPDGSTAQRRLISVLQSTAPQSASLVTFSVYCNATPGRESSARTSLAVQRPVAPVQSGRSATGSTEPSQRIVTAEDIATTQADLEAAELAEAKAAKSEMQSREVQRAMGVHLIGRGSISLREILSTGFEPLTEPIRLEDSNGAETGMISATLLAKDAVQRAKRASLRAGGAVELWIHTRDGLMLSTAVRADPSIIFLSLEAHLEIDASTTAGVPASRLAAGKRSAQSSSQTTLASRSLRVARGAQSAAAWGSGASLPIELQGCIVLPPGSSSRAALQRAVTRGGTDSAIAFTLFTSPTESVDSAERRVVGSARVPVNELLARTPKAPGSVPATSPSTALAITASEGNATSDGLPLQLNLYAAGGEMVGTITVEVDGLDAVRALGMDNNAKSRARVQDDLSRAACRGDADALRRCLELGADLRKSDALGQTALHWAAAAPSVDASAPTVDACLRAGANVTGPPNLVGMTPLHWASAWGEIHNVRALIRSGAPREALDIQQRTPASMAHSIRERVNAATISSPSFQRRRWRTGIDGSGSDARLRRLSSTVTVAGKREGRLALLRELLGPQEAAARHIQRAARGRLRAAPPTMLAM